MTNEIVKMVAKKANISESVAQTAVDTVLNMLKNKLPASIGGALESFLGSGAVTTSKGGKTAAKNTKKDESPFDIGDIAGALGGLLGKK